MTSGNQRFLNHLGVTTWHEAGYTGKRGLTATAEDEARGGHAKQTADVFRLFAPDRELIYLPTETSYIGGEYQSKLLTDALPVVKARRVDTLFASVSNSIRGTVFDAALAEVEPFFTYFAAAGNDEDRRYNHYLDSLYIYGVGAYNLMVSDGSMSPALYSSESEHVDFAAPALIFGLAGTSYATPALCGMAALVNDFFIHKTGKPLSSGKMYQFLKDHSVDIYTEGKDTKTGWGAPILPHPDKIDISKYKGESGVNFTDKSDIDSSHYTDVLEAVNIGLIQGYPDGSFAPKRALTREQAASLMMRLYRRVRGGAK